MGLRLFIKQLLCLHVWRHYGTVLRAGDLKPIVQVCKKCGKTKVHRA